MEHPHRKYTTSGIAVSFAQQGVAMDTIARSLVAPREQVEHAIRTAFNSGVIAALPPATSGDIRSAMHSELINLRAQLAACKDLIRELADKKSEGVADFHGVAGLTRKEATVVNALLVHGRLSRERIYHECYGGFDASDMPEPKIVDVFICKIRKKLAPHNVSIQNMWGFGFEMTGDNKERMRALAGLPHIESPPMAPELAGVA